MTLPAEFLRAVAAGFPADFLTREPAELTEYGRDWTRVHAPAPSAVVFPRSTDEVSRFLALCNQHRVAVVPSGGRTGLAGGAVAPKGEVVLSLRRMTRIDPIDFHGSTIRVQAGVITEAVHKYCEEYGLTWPIDFAAKGSAQVGGNVATNAGGLRVIRYGLTRQWVLGLQVVTATGQVLELNGALEKNNTGLDLRQLFIGSEGILGVITEATLKLTRLPGRRDTLLFAVPSMAGVVELFREARRGPFVIAAYEFFTDRCLGRLQRHRNVRSPFEGSWPFYVLMEAEEAEPAKLEEWVGSLFARSLVSDGTMAQGQAQVQELWALREGISEALAATGLPHKNDIALPVAALEAFVAELDEVFTQRYPGWEIALFGHIGDGNLHVNVMKPDELPKEAFLQRTSESDHAMFTLVRKHGGSISAEHGVGLLKRAYLGYSRSEEELRLMRELKRVFDPNGILNPGKVL